MKPLIQIGIIPPTHIFYKCMNEMLGHFTVNQQQSIRSFLESVVYDISLCYWISNTEKTTYTHKLIDILQRDTYHRLENDNRWYKKWKGIDTGNWLDYFILTSYKVARRELVSQYKNYRKYESAV